MFDIESCQFVGYLTKTFGVKGRLQIKFEENFYTELIEKTDSVFLLLDGLLVPFQINEIEISGNTAIINLKNIDSIEKAQKLKSTKVYIHQLHNKSKKNKELGDYIGYHIEDINIGYLGQIININLIPKNPLFEIKINDKIILIPAHDNFIKSIDNKKCIIRVNMPEGFYNI